jgi:hypothetical protein
MAGNIQNRLNALEKQVSKPSGLVIEIYPGWIYLCPDGIQKGSKAYGDTLLDLILDDLPKGTKVVYHEGAKRLPARRTKKARARKEEK